MKNKYIVFDTSTLVSALLFNNSIPQQALTKALKHYHLVVSEYTEKELIEVMSRKKFDRYSPPNKRKDLVTEFLYQSELIYPIQPVENDCRDPKDIPFLELASTAKASLIISSDSDLLDLHPFYDISIMKPAEFLDFLG